jgi:hypothetical protein
MIEARKVQYLGGVIGGEIDMTGPDCWVWRFVEATINFEILNKIIHVRSFKMPRFMKLALSSVMTVVGTLYSLIYHHSLRHQTNGSMMTVQLP